MLETLLRHRRLLMAGALLILLLALAGVVLAARGGADVVVYNGRSQYGDEAAFAAFEKQTGLDVQLRGGTAPELFERLRREGDDTPADLLVTTDLANLQRADDAGLLAPVRTAALERQVAPDLHAQDGSWWGLSTRVRTLMRSTKRVEEGALRDYPDLGDPRWRGRVCLRTSNNEYNQSLVADLLVKRGEERTRRMLRGWMANRPRVLGSDVDVLEAIAGGRCDVGLTNHYYLGRRLQEEPDFPVAPAWPDQDGRGAHTNLSGVGLVRGSEHRAAAVRLMEFLTAAQAQRSIVAGSELPANPAVPAAAHIRKWASVKRDTIDVARAGARLDDAVALMQEVGWR